MIFLIPHEEGMVAIEARLKYLKDTCLLKSGQKYCLGAKPHGVPDLWLHHLSDEKTHQ